MPALASIEELSAVFKKLKDFKKKHPQASEDIIQLLKGNRKIGYKNICGAPRPHGRGTFFFGSSSRLGEIPPRKPFIHTLTDMAFGWRGKMLLNEATPESLKE